MKLLTNIIVSRVIPCRFAKGKPRMKPLNMIRWRNEEVVRNLDESLSVPYKQAQPKTVVLRSSETNPSNHSWTDEGKIYTMPESVRNQFFSFHGMNQDFERLCDIFNENGILVRKPALEVIDFLKKTDYSKLPIKYCLYGDIGTGKSLILLHILHYALENEYIVLHLPSVHHYLRSNASEANYNENKENVVDMPINGALILKRFQLQNESLIEKLELKTTKEYQWNLRESLPAGSPLILLVQHGINRIKYSCDVIEALTNELKLAATHKKFRLYVSIENVNSVYESKLILKINGTWIKAADLSLFRSLKSILEPDWCNGAVVTSVSPRGLLPENRTDSTTLLNLLRRDALEALDPFIPIHVPNFNELEFDNYLNYYEDRRWLQRYAGREEIEFLTTRNPDRIQKYCAPL